LPANEGTDINMIANSDAIPKLVIFFIIYSLLIVVGMGLNRICDVKSLANYAYLGCLNKIASSLSDFYFIQSN